MSDIARDRIVSHLKSATAEALGVDSASLSLETFLPTKGIADETLKLKAFDEGRECRAVVLMSSEVSPGIAHRNAALAREARDALSPRLGSVPLVPLAEGEFDGRTFIVMPVAERLSDWRLVRRLQLPGLRREVLSWLAGITAETMHRDESSTTDDEFREALRLMADFPEMSTEVREASARALERIDRGDWTPCHVLMHGDLWLGNVMRRPASERSADQAGIVIIDWAGSRVRGYPLFDLVRFCDTARSTRSRFRREVSRHVAILGCEPVDAIGNLLAALGCLGRDLEHYPVRRFLGMSAHCLRYLLPVLP